MRGIRSKGEVKKLKLELKSWSKDHFGSLQARIDDLINLIGDLDSRDEQGPLPI